MDLDMSGSYCGKAEKIFNDWRFFSGSAMTLGRVESFPRGSLPSTVNVQLSNRGLWRQFHGQTTEMIITKLGRRMFPAIQVSITGLEPHVKYHVLLEIAPASQRRHKYVGSGWTVAGNAEVQSPPHKRLYLHPDSPATGKHWGQQPVSFAKLKLTNNNVDHHNNIVLTSMHKYIPKIWIIQSDGLGSISNIYSQPSACFTFEETEFIAVTAYQNESITKLKIDNNPFAKGFRDTGHYRCKRKLEESQENSQEEDPRTPGTPEPERMEKIERIEVEESNENGDSSDRRQLEGL
ncbi:T-box-containing protein TBX6L-like [Diachasma alloeum]|uniref:T-box-containing protein TBX6L-like n=1 Tax=Diachasma alloeum TaxID=454923 RepID=UPI0010FAED8A|nr:T-box-containing protein TBX6L-like [Diachasma alloeum]